MTIRPMPENTQTRFFPNTLPGGSTQPGGGKGGPGGPQRPPMQPPPGGPGPLIGSPDSGFQIDPAALERLRLEKLKRTQTGGKGGGGGDVIMDEFPKKKPPIGGGKGGGGGFPEGPSYPPPGPDVIGPDGKKRPTGGSPEYQKEWWKRNGGGPLEATPTPEVPGKPPMPGGKSGRGGGPELPPGVHPVMDQSGATYYVGPNGPWTPPPGFDKPKPPRGGGKGGDTGPLTTSGGKGGNVATGQISPFGGPLDQSRIRY